MFQTLKFPLPPRILCIRVTLSLITVRLYEQYIYICMDIQAECADGIGIQIMAAASIPAGVTLVAFEIPGWVIYSRVG